MGLFEQLGEILKPENFLKVELSEYCPDCYCTVPIIEWECIRADNVEITECPECGYRNKC